MARRPYGKLNWSPTKAIAGFELALAQYVHGDRKAADQALADLIANGRDWLAYQIAGLPECEARRTKRLSGYKSRSMLTTPGS